MNPVQQKLPRRAAASLALVRAAFGETPDTGLFEGVEDRDWKSIYSFSSREGILPIVYDGIKHLPQHLWPQKQLMLTWGVNTEISAERYHKRNEAMASLARFYAANSIKTLILKGYSLSIYYPIPEHRECGDIDIFLEGNFDEGNRLITEKGIHVSPPVSKHSSFVFDGVTIENHRDIINANRNHRLRKLDGILKVLAATEPHALSLDSGDKPHSETGTDVLALSPSANAVYLLAHAASHFSGGELAIRNLCDWARFLAAEHGSIDWEFFNRTVMHAKLDRLCSLMTAFAEDYLDLESMGFPEPEPELREKFNALVFAYGKHSAPEGEQFHARVKRIWSTRWRSRVVRENFVRQLLYVAVTRRRGHRLSENK